MSIWWVAACGVVYAVITLVALFFETKQERGPLGVRLSPLAAGAASLWWASEVWASRPFNGLLARGLFSTAAFFLAGTLFVMVYTGALAFFSMWVESSRERP